MSSEEDCEDKAAKVIQPGPTADLLSESVNQVQPLIASNNTSMTFQASVDGPLGNMFQSMEIGAD